MASALLVIGSQCSRQGKCSSQTRSPFKTWNRNTRTKLSGYSVSMIVSGKIRSPNRIRTSIECSWTKQSLTFWRKNLQVGLHKTIWRESSCFLISVLMRMRVTFMSRVSNWLKSFNLRRCRRIASRSWRSRCSWRRWRGPTKIWTRVCQKTFQFWFWGTSGLKSSSSWTSCPSRGTKLRVRLAWQWSSSRWPTQNLKIADIIFTL